MANDGWRNKEPGILQARGALKSNPHNFIILDDRTTTVSRIDGGIGLHGQELAVSNMGIGFHLNSRDDAARVRNLLAAGRIAVGNDRAAHFRQFTKFQFIQALKKALVLNSQDCKVAVMADKFDLGNVWMRVLITMDD